MLDFLLEIPVFPGILIVTSFLTVLGLVVTIQIKKLLKKRITKQHEKVGRILFRVTAGLIALLISLSYANERINESKIIDSIEEETSLLVAAIIGLKYMDSPEAEEIEVLLERYVNHTVDDDWKQLMENPYFSESNLTLIKAYRLALELPASNSQEELQKSILIKDIHEINKLMQTKIYSPFSQVPYLIYILFIGLFFMWIFFTVYELNFVSLLFLSLYNILIGVLIYFVFMLNNPMIGPMKIEPHSFYILKSKGLDFKFK
jgi:hypothetical protein